MAKMWMPLTVVTLLFSGGAAMAQDYPWCAIYHDEIGARTCAFESYAECMETARGGGAYCEQNAAYKAPDPEPAAAESQPAPEPVAKKKPARKKAATSPKPQ